MKNRRSLFALPYVVWMALFVVAPILLVVVYAFSSAAGGATLENFRDMGGYWVVFLRSFELAVVATAVCLVIGYPISYLMAREGPRFQRVATVAIMLPMWMNFLLRTYAWMSILENTGLLNRLFSAIRLFDLVNAVSGALNSAFGLKLATDVQYFQMINTSGAVVLGMVYNYLPFMILPIYTAMTKIDDSIIEAAQDLGCNVWQILWRVLVPLTGPGIATGITQVFVPSVSTFIISRMLGGGSNLLIGDLIELQFLGNSYNLNLGSAMSLVLMVIVLLCMSFTSSFDESEMEGVM